MNDALRADLERYLDGGMSPDETAAFLNSVRHDPDALLLLGRSLEDQAYLYDALRARRENETRPAGDTSRILRIRRTSRRPRAQGGPGGAWIAGTVAAAAAVLLLIYATSTEPRPKPTAPQSPIVKSIPVPEPLVPQPSRPDPLPMPPPPTPAPDVAKPIPAPPVPPPAPLPVPEPAPVARPDKPAPTVAQPPPEPPKKAIGRVEQTGIVTPLVSGQSVEGPALVRFTDGTKVDIAAGTTLKEVVEDAGGKKIVLGNGALLCDAARQPTGKPFLVQTPHAVARVIGTVFKVSIEAAATKLEVREGKVQLKRLSDSKSVDVAAGNFAVAADGAELAARPSPIDEILLVPAQGEIGGGEWRAVQDPAASTGIAFECLRTTNRQPHKQTADSARVTWTFRADANRDYYVWVRGFAPSKVDAVKRDAVVLEFVEAVATEREGPAKGRAGGPGNALFNGYMARPGYWWVGGDADGGNDEVPVTVRFAKPGVQTVRLIASEVPIRIDSILISSTQKTRP